MSQFSQVLILRNTSKHAGQSLWKYDLSDNEFFHLKKNLCENKRLNEIDSRDCALYYAEWWKRCFNGGIPSKKDVYTTIANGQWYDEEDFFQHAKKGARLLGIQWIKNQNTLYFRTLLLQGGLPIKHISNNRGTYKNFLLKILELNPHTIDDFAFNPSVTSLLPKSSRNDEIYDCCLNIVRAIINEDEEYLNILDNNADLREISNELRIKKQSFKFESRKSKFRTTWVFELESGQISLYLGFFEMTSKDFRNLFLKDDSEDPMDYEYKLYYDNDILCKFIKKANGQFMPIWVNKIDLIWNGNEQFLDLFLVNSNGVRIECNNLISHMPQLSKPSLWASYSDSQWILEKGSRTSQEEGFVLFPDDYVPEHPCHLNDVSVCDKSFKWISFTKSVILIKEQESYTFKSNCKKIEWYIIDEKPDWLLRANRTVVRSRPKVLVYDETGNIIQNVLKKWRQKQGVVWHDWHGAIPHGLIEMQIQTGEIIEYDEFFNISLLGIKIHSNSLHQANVELVNNDFLFDIYDNDLVEIEKMNSNKISLSLKTKTSIPNSIQATLKIPQQNKSLRFEISPPFKGMEIIDNNQNIVVSGTGFNLENLSGYRLMSNNANLSYHLYNTKRKKIIISERFLETSYPLRNFEDKINQLYTLSDSMDGDAEIALEIYEGGVNKQTKIKEYRFQRYNQKIHWSFDENKSVVIDTSPLKAELFAIPLDCKNEEINLLEVENNNGKYLFIPIPGIVKYIIFSDKESSAKMQPSFISIDPENEMTTMEERLSRVMCFSEELLSSEYDKDIWQRFLSYYKICSNNDLSYATFDILRSVGYSSALATKAFVFLVCFDDNQLFVEQYCKKMEGDLGFSFHWANKEHWAAAMEWIGCYSNLELMKHISSVLKFYFTSHHPFNQFKRISDFVLQNTQPVMENGYFLNGKINDLRTSLGEKVLSQLPQTCPKIPDLYKQVIPVNENSAKVKVLLKSPLAVALSIAGKDDSLWNKDNEYIRRNVKYSYQLSPDWYSEAINYSLSKI